MHVDEAKTGGLNITAICCALSLTLIGLRVLASYYERWRGLGLASATCRNEIHLVLSAHIQREESELRTPRPSPMQLSAVSLGRILLLL